MASKWVRERILVPEDLNREQRESIAEEVLSHIRKRTSKGFDKNDRPFKEYTKGYIESLDFKNAGKSQKPNLKLSGDMMAAMDTISTKKGSILIGFENGTPENDRADGNITGSYGGEPDSKKKRDFLGIRNKDLKGLINGVTG